MNVPVWIAKHKVLAIVVASGLAASFLTWFVLAAFQKPAKDLSTMPSVEAGAYLVDTLGCRSCHQPDNAYRAPIFGSSRGRPIRFADGSLGMGNREYYREAIQAPSVKVREGYQNVMPSYAQSLTPEDLERILDYLLSDQAR